MVILQAIICVMSGLAGIFWVKSATVKLPSVTSTQYDGEGAFAAALAKQGKWNTRAAWSAAIATLFQVLTFLLPYGT
jgi:hypothetical protein